MIVLALASWVGGCGGPGKGYEGIWMLTLSPWVDNDPTAVITHNFLDAVEPMDTTVGPWTYTTTGEQSDGIVMVEIFGLDGRGEDEVILVMEGEIFPGRETEEKGTWEFTWEGTEDSQSSEAHVDGYRYTRADSDLSTTVIRMTFDGASATGTVENTTNLVVEYAESDVWDPMDNYLGYTQMPSNSYVFDATGVGINNIPDTSECTADPCFLNVATTFAGSASFTASWTRYRDAGAFDAVDTVGQPHGTGFNPYYYP